MYMAFQEPSGGVGSGPRARSSASAWALVSIIGLRVHAPNARALAFGDSKLDVRPSLLRSFGLMVHELAQGAQI